MITYFPCPFKVELVEEKQFYLAGVTSLNMFEIVCECVSMLLLVLFAFGPSWPRRKAIRRARWQAGPRSDHPGRLDS